MFGCHFWSKLELCHSRESKERAPDDVKQNEDSFHMMWKELRETRQLQNSSMAEDEHEIMALMWGKETLSKVLPFLKSWSSGSLEKLNKELSNWHNWHEAAHEEKPSWLIVLEDHDTFFVGHFYILTSATHNAAMIPHICRRVPAAGKPLTSVPRHGWGMAPKRRTKDKEPKAMPLANRYGYA